MPSPAADPSPQAAALDYQALFAHSPLPMWVYDVHTHAILEVNDAATARYGYTRAEFLRLTLNDLQPPAEAAPTAGGRRHRTRAGTCFNVDPQISAVTFGGRAAALFIAVTLTEPPPPPQIEQQRRFLQAVHEIDQTITSSVDLRLNLHLLLAHVLTQLGVAAATVLLFDPGTQLLTEVARRGFKSNTPSTAPLRLGDGQAGRAALARRTVHVTEVTGLGPAGLATRSLAAEGLSGYYAVPLMVKGQLRGVLEVFQRAGSPPAQLGDEAWLDFLHTLAGQAALAIDNATLFDELQRAQAQRALAYDTTVEGWARALDLHDHAADGHAQRVASLALRLAERLGLRAEALPHVRRGALLHDIGKLGVPDHILHKPDPLTDAEVAVLRRHPIVAHDLLAPIEYLRPALEIPYCHHEHWDGSGYPRGLQGEQIPLSARIVAVADAWDALTFDPAASRPRPSALARAHMQAQAGRHYDPAVVAMFLRGLDGASLLSDVA